MKQSIILHVGAYKTATSTIQSLFTLHSAEIAKTFGILYPKTFRRVNSGVTIESHPKTDSFGHHLLAHHLRNTRAGLMPQTEHEAFFRTLRQEIEDTACRTVFLSTELLTFCNAQDKAFVAAQLGGFDLRILYAIRNPVDFRESINNQRLKSGLPVKPANNPIGFLRNITEWETVVGLENVNVLPFASRHFDVFLQLFLAAFTDDEFSNYARRWVPRTNSSVSTEGARLRMLFDRFIPPPHDMTPRVRHAVNRMLAELDASLDHRTALVTLDSAVRRAVQDLNLPQIRTLCERFIPPAHWPILLEPEKGLLTERNDLTTDTRFSVEDIEKILGCFAEMKRVTKC